MHYLHRCVWLIAWVILHSACSGQAPEVPAIADTHAVRASAAPQLPSASASIEAELMDWGETHYPKLFPASERVDGVLDPFVYRAYPSTGNYLGVSTTEDAGVYVLGPVSSGQLLRVGAASDFRCLAAPALCIEPQPRPVLPSSYENAKAIGMPPRNLEGLPPADALAYGDFFQEGRYSIVLNTLRYNAGDPSTSGDFGSIRFYREEEGRWVDRTSLLLANDVGCLHPRKALVADFNGDAKPDVFFACHGFDGPPFPGEKQKLLLSRPGGGYENVTLDFSCFCHGASAAPLERPGYADVLVVNQLDQPLFLMNRGNGTFTADTTRLAPMKFMQIWTAELVDFQGKGRYDAFLAGAEPGTAPSVQIPPTFFLNDGTNHFKSAKVEIPLGPAQAKSQVGIVLDAVVDPDFVYLLRAFDRDNQPNYGLSIQKTARPSLATTEIYSHTGTFNPAYPGTTWFPYLGVSGRYLVSPNSFIGVKVPR